MSNLPSHFEVIILGFTGGVKDRSIKGTHLHGIDFHHLRIDFNENLGNTYQ